jgi:phosphatidylserine/phosphatidylglycerophosphate/cardiolipin synthase-like enzyme
MTFELAAELAAEFQKTSLTEVELYGLLATGQPSSGRIVSPELWRLATSLISASTMARVEFAAACAGALRALRDSASPSPPLLLIGPADWIPSQTMGVVSDIQHALVEMVASATDLVTLMAPFGTADAIARAIQPLTVLEKTAATKLQLLTAGQPAQVDVLVERLRRGLPSSIRRRTTVFLAPPGEVMWPHAKLLLIDDRTGYLGSANFTSGGLDRYFELGLVLSATQASLLQRVIVPKLLHDTFTTRREVL